jgi:enoyl-CoA hydratase
MQVLSKTTNFVLPPAACGTLDAMDDDARPRLDATTYETLGFERLGPVLRVTLDHPGNELNAVDGLLHGEFTRLFRELKQEDQARAVVLTARGRTFSAGGSFDWFPELEDFTALDHLRRDAKQLIWDLLDVEIPIVAAVNGPAIGLGASLALLCDVIFMADTATLADPHVRVGIAAGDGGTLIWPLVLGPARAKQYLLTGDALTADEAERLGLVNAVVPAGELQETALAFANRLAAGAPLAIRYTKQAINAGIKAAAGTVFDVSTALEITTLRSADHREALAAMREKRPPSFRGK